MRALNITIHRYVAALIVPNTYSAGYIALHHHFAAIANMRTRFASGRIAAHCYTPTITGINTVCIGRCRCNHISYNFHHCIIIGNCPLPIRCRAVFCRSAACFYITSAVFGTHTCIIASGIARNLNLAAVLRLRPIVMSPTALPTFIMLPASSARAPIPRP